MTWNQSGIDLPTLARELGQLRAAMKEADDKDDQDEAIGPWTLGIAEKIGVAVAAEAIKRAM